MGVTLAACAVALVPWLVRNEANVGCFTLTTDSRALWKANNLDTYDTLDRGRLDRRRAEPRRRAALAGAGGRSHAVRARRRRVDECAQMRLYRREVIDFWQDHPGEKARLMGQAARMLWDPRSIRTEGRAEAGGFVDDARTWVQPLYTIPLYVLGVIGLFVMPRRIAVLFVALLAYNTLAALVFAGRDALPRAVGLRARARCRGGRRLAPRSLETGAMRVVHVHRIGGIGGSERHLLTLLPALAAKGVDVSLRRARHARRRPVLRRAAACRSSGCRGRGSSAEP